MEIILHGETSAPAIGSAGIPVEQTEFLNVLGAASVAGFGLGRSGSAQAAAPYEMPRFGNVSLLHMTDCHAQLLPIHFREPSVNLGFGDHEAASCRTWWASTCCAPPSCARHAEAHALTYLDFEASARRYGKVGGFAHLATLVKQLRASRPGALLLDGGDTWQGSGHRAVDARARTWSTPASCWAWTS
jgi:sulfur-oxidizing protein SoxB